MRLNHILILIMTLYVVELRAQTTLNDYRQEVINYSHEMQIADLATETAEADMRRAHKGYLPSLSLGAETSLDFDDNLSRPWAWLAEASLSQTIYSGGSVRSRVKRQELQHSISEVDRQMALMDVIYSADKAYWQLSRAESYLAIIREYVAAVDSLRRVVKRRYDEGYSAKGDLLQIESRISDAHYQLSSAEQSYHIALHTFNSLCGRDIDSNISLGESIVDIRMMPERESVSEVIEHHPRYQSMRLSVEESLWGIKSSLAEFLPTLRASVYGIVQPTTPYIKGGGSKIDGGAVLSLSAPIYHFGERHEAERSAKAHHLQQIAQMEQAIDDIELIEGDAWANIYNARHRVDVTRESLSIAEENLEMSIYSYGEGMATILDVLQAQISWLQISQNAIASYYDYAMAISSYEYATAASLH